MRLIDIQCARCGVVTVDWFQRTADAPLPNCSVPVPADVPTDGEPVVTVCGGATTRVYLPTTRPTVIGDDIPGGVLIHNGLCNADGTPRRYYSKTEMHAEAKRRGLEQHVQHKPGPSSDKSAHTSKWV